MEAKEKITEQPSHYDHLEQMSVGELLTHISEEDALVAEAVRKVIPQIQAFVEAVEPRMRQGGTLFYVGLEPAAGLAYSMPANCHQHSECQQTG